MKKKKKENYLDFIPVSAPEHTWDVDREGIVTIDIENKGIYHWLAQKLFKKPRMSHIALDELGSFVWQQMDGKRSIYEIAQLVKSEYGEKADPLYERLSKYFQILYRNHFIGYVKKEK